MSFLMKKEEKRKMIIQGKYNRAVCYASTLEEKAEEQIRMVCDREEFADCKIRIMPDVHAGKGCTIGTTMTVKDKVVPGMVGVDIGCGMETVRIAETDIDFERLDRVIRESVPSGMNIRETPHPLADGIDLGEIRCQKEISVDRAVRSVGTLGGGNHFIEVDKDEEGAFFLVVHSGSRHLGCEVAEYYQKEGYRALCGRGTEDVSAVIARMKSEGRASEIQATLERMRAAEKPLPDIPAELAYVEGGLLDDYIHDMRIVQRFAALNRVTMTKVILEGMGWTETDRFTTVHNYIDTDNMILRKGAVSAEKGKRLLIPINMRDGSLICVGKGNPEWNCSAPHGAGRLMSRSAARARLTMEEYAAQMSGIYTTCVAPDTLDESPMAYKNMEEIVACIGPTAEIVSRIRPVYNFKAGE